MKKVIQLSLFIAVLFFFSKLNAQFQIWVEQNSGVSSNLTSASFTPQMWQPIQVWVCGDAGVVLKSNNVGTNWLNVSAGVPSNLNLAAISCGGFDTTLTAGNIGMATFVYRTTNGGANWTQVFSQQNGHVNAIWMRNALEGFMVGNPVGGRWSLWKTTNGGMTWDSSGMYLPQSGSETGYNNSLCLLNNNIWFGTNNSRIYKSSNNGLNWMYATTPEVRSTAVWIYWDTMGFTYALVGGSNLYSTTNGGSNWTLSNCPDTGSFRGIGSIVPGVANGYPYGIVAVRNYTKVYSGYFNLQPEYTAPSGTYNYMTSFPQWVGTAWAVRSNGGITRIALFRGGAVRRISSEIPETYSLYQNYPNPFNPVTKIRFDISPLLGGVSEGPGGLVKLIIFDLLGKEIATVVNESLLPGTYEVQWDGTNFPSGVYLYRLSAGNYVETKRMVLLK
jgi:photosystem II stability/assembly factor-like uncharacterized protein